MRTSRRLLAAAAAAAAAAALLTACDADEPVLSVGHDDTLAGRTAAAVYAGALARTGMAVETESAPRTDAELLDATASGDLGLFPAFSGDLLGRLRPTVDVTAGPEVLADLNRSLPQRVAVSDATAVSDRWQVLASSAAVDATGTADLADCARLGTAGLPLVVVTEPPAEILDAVSVCPHAGVERVDSGDALLAQVRSGRALGLATALQTALADDSAGVQSLASDGAPIAQDLVAVYAAGRMEKPQLKALSRVAGELTTTDLAQLMREVRDGGDPRAVAARWLATRGV